MAGGPWKVSRDGALWLIDKDGRVIGVRDVRGNDWHIPMVQTTADATEAAGSPIGGAGGSGANLTFTRDGTTVTVISDTGTDAVIPAASAAAAGVLTAADKSKLDGIEAGATADMTPTEIVSAINTLLGGTTWQSGGGAGGATNLSMVASPTGVDVLSDTGTDITLPLADATNSGLMSPAQFTKLAGIAAGAQVNPTGAQIVAAIDTQLGSSAWQGGAGGTLTVETVAGTTYALSAADDGKVLRFTASGAIAVSLPTAFSGKSVTLQWQDTTGTITVTPSGTTLNGAGTAVALSAARGAVTITPTGTANDFDMLGAIGDLQAAHITDSTAVGRSLLTAADAAAARTAAGAAAAAQTFYVSFYVPTVADGDVCVLPVDFSGTVTKVVTQSASGTCTLTGKINATNLGGAANSVSATKTSQAHATANAFVAGDNLVFTASANSSCLGMRVTVAYTRTLA